MTPEEDAELRDVWSRGSYSTFGRHYLGMAARLVERTGVGATDDVLDVGCGTGNVAVTAARRGGRVVGLDVTPRMLELARDNADVAGVDGIEWRVGDATDLPFEEDAFDATLSSLGHMYGDPPEAAARELIRVTRTGGRVGFTAWTPTGLFPAMAGLVVAHLPAEARPEFPEPPFVWGDRDAVEDRLGAAVEDLSFERGTVAYPALSPSHFWDEVATDSGTFLTFLESIEDRSSLREATVETIEPHFAEEGNAVELEFLLTTAIVA